MSGSHLIHHELDTTVDGVGFVAHVGILTAGFRAGRRAIVESRHPIGGADLLDNLCLLLVQRNQVHLVRICAILDRAAKQNTSEKNPGGI